MADVFVDLGLRIQDIIAGLSGGVVNAFVFRRSEPWSIIGSVVVGALTANYLSEPAIKYTGTSGPATAFIVGLCGMAICQGIFAAVQRVRFGQPATGGPNAPP